jgi:Helix-turn-helix domain
MPDRLALSEQEAAEALGISARTLRTWRGRGIVPYVRVGGVVLYSPDGLRDWVRKPFDDHEEVELGQIKDRATGAVPDPERQVARGRPAGRRKSSPPKPRLPLGLIRG